MNIRSYQGKDETELLHLWQTTLHHDRITQDIFRVKVLLDPNFQPSKLPVAVVDGHIVGFVLALTRQVPLFLQGLEPDKAWITAFGVHPDYRRRGIGHALFDFIFGHIPEHKTLEISPYVPNYFAPGVDVDAYPEALEFLNALDFEIIERPISMGINLTHFQIPAAILELEARRLREDHLIICTVHAEDLPNLMPFIAEHFGWDWYRHAQEYLLEYFTGSTQVCFLVALLNGEIVGFCQQRRERFGPFGVHPDKRNLGIGRLMLYRCLAEMSARGFYYAYFMWTEENAARLYASVGFQKRREFAIFRKHL